MWGPKNLLKPQTKRTKTQKKQPTKLIKNNPKTRKKEQNAHTKHKTMTEQLVF